MQKMQMTLTGKKHMHLTWKKTPTPLSLKPLVVLLADGRKKKKKMKWLRKMKMKRMLKVKRVQGGSCGQYRMSPVEKEDGRMMKKKKRTTRMIEYQRG
eukprot:scaffold326026_cov23-Attheya_sp.AAC.1